MTPIGPSVSAQKGCNTLTRRGKSPAPLVMALSSDMIEEEDLLASNSDGQTGDDKTGMQVDGELCSEAEVKLYQMITEVRAKLAEDNNAAPYAICSDQTVRSFAKKRPTTVRNMLKIDGVNQTFINNHSMIFIYSIQEMATDLGLELDSYSDDELSSDFEDDCSDDIRIIKDTVQYLISDH